MTPRTNSNAMKSRSYAPAAIYSEGSYQGTTSVVPNNAVKSRALAPVARAAIIYAAIFLLASASLWAPIARAQQTDHAKKLGMKLMCVCGCAQVLVQCNHLNCPSSAPELKELDERIASGASDDMIVQDFVQGYGVQVLSSPPNSGFNRVAWLLPSVAFALGLGLIALVINHWRKRPILAATSPQSSQAGISAGALARAREKVDRETEE